MSPQEQFSKFAAETTNLFLQLEDVRAKLRSAQTPDERARLEAEAAQLTEMLAKTKAQMKTAGDELVNRPEARVSWWKRISQSMSSKAKAVDVRSPRNALLREFSSTCELSPPAKESELAATESSCGVSLPQPLREILSESNGLLAPYGAKLLWSTAEITQHNKEFWTDQTLRAQYQPFDKLFFIGDDASGDQFAFAIEQDRKIHHPDIYRWEHETDARSKYAKDLETFLRKAVHEEG